jgi:hypothetical protein
MNAIEAVVHQQSGADLNLPKSRRELMVKSSRKILLAVAFTSTVGWIYLLSKGALFVGAALFF